MKVSISVFLGIMAQLFFCVFFLFLFANNALIRPTAHGILYKEYFIGAFLLLMIYLNALVFYPKFYLCNRHLLYILLSLASIAVAIAVEFAWIYHDVMREFQPYMSDSMAQRNFWGRIPFVFLRDAGGLSMTFLICELIHLHHRAKCLDKTLVENPGIIVAEDAGHDMVLLKTQDIAYCEQEGNYTKICREDKRLFFRYGSLTNFISLIGKDTFVQINRNTVVNKHLITACSDGKIWISGEEQPFLVSPNMLDQQFLQTITDQNSRNLKQKDRNSDHASDKSLKKSKEKIYQLIAEEPGVSAVQLAAETGISQSTINRHIARLKQQGLIEHVGANKTGGYRVVERLEMRDER